MKASIRRAGKAFALLVGVAAATAVTAMPAGAHAEFPAVANPSGDADNPYPAGSRQTLAILATHEQGSKKFGDAYNTNVDIRVTLPAGWTSPACGDVRTKATGGGPGDPVAGWTCAVETAAGATSVHWWGPQVAAGVSPVASAQYFTFTVTTPSPAQVSAYGDENGSSPGFRVLQRYADGYTSLWQPPNEPAEPAPNPGNRDAAFGLVRSVAGAGSQPTPTPQPAGAAPTPTPAPAAAGTPTPLPAATPAPAAGGGTTGDGTPTEDDDPLPHTGASRLDGMLLLGSALVAAGMLTMAAAPPPAGPRRQRRRR